MLKSLILAIAMMFAVAGCQTMTGQTAGQNAADAKITASVKGKLASDRMLSITRVDVDTEDSVVYLTGVVDSPDQKQRAEQRAREVSGVKDVVNNLHIKSQSPS